MEDLLEPTKQPQKKQKKQIKFSNLKTKSQTKTVKNTLFVFLQSTKFNQKSAQAFKTVAFTIYFAAPAH